jgi:hypothetical protein
MHQLTYTVFCLLVGYIVGYTHRDMTAHRMTYMSITYIVSWIYCAAYTLHSIYLQIW